MRLTRVTDGYVITSILNTYHVEAEIQELLVELDEIKPAWNLTGASEEK
jgi:hypothetical protein